ncbi:Ankyrin_repeat protein 1 [Hexamita inflata]|uniref:Ankyrin repeat protein 1 n=1 Tax=Hexamita inflata TaxID=28002 RepID=A0AA86TVR8_9EUKA|nr:Ankyrin repeat protein 1 [Hexamita inflata]
MGCGANQEETFTWFQAAKAGNIPVIQQLIPKMARQVDQRITDADQDQFHGFSAIHYAVIYEQIDAVQELIEHEYFSRLQSDIQIMAPNIGPQAKYMLKEGSSIIHLSILVANYEITKYILNYSHKSGQSLIGIPDANGQYAINLLFSIQTTNYVIKVLHNQAMESELNCDFISKQCPGPLHMAGLFGRYKLIEHLLEYIQSHPQVEYLDFKESIFKLVLMVHQNQSPIDAAKMPMDISRCGVISSERFRCQQAIQQLVEMAIQYLLDQGGISAQIAQDYQTFQASKE